MDITVSFAVFFSVALVAHSIFRAGGLWFAPQWQTANLAGTAMPPLRCLPLMVGLRMIVSGLWQILETQG